MAKSIKNRVYGSDVPLWLKDKIELRQKLSKSSEFGNSIDDLNILRKIFMIVGNNYQYG